MVQGSGPRPVFRVITTPSEAEENLRLIRSAMERSTRHSTLSGLSGVLAGILALAACLVAAAWVGPPAAPENRLAFVVLWGATLALAALGDILLTKRRATRVGKTAFSPLGRQLARAVAPGLLAGVATTLLYLAHPVEIGPFLYGLWMLCYAMALLSIGMLSVREVSWLGWSFLAAGASTLLLPEGFPIGPRAAMAVSFGGFHVVYGFWMGIKHGW
ncbi:MAG: hypothetical protein ACKO5K_01580 [Armatimonadota bacterium]